MAQKVLLGSTAGSKRSTLSTSGFSSRNGSRGFPAFFAFAAFAILLAGSVAILVGCYGGLLIPPPRAGVVELFDGLMVPVPGGLVNASGGNLHIARDDLSVDTQVGEWKVGAVWNSAAGAWRWNFDSSLKAYQPGVSPTFRDDTGYAFFLQGVGYDKPVLGSHWVWHDANAMRTRGGLIYRFDEAGELSSVNWISAEYPALHFERAEIRGASRVTSIEQCKTAVDCSTLYSMSYDSQGRLVSIVDLAGRTALYTYAPGSARIASARDALDVANGWPGFRYEYDAAGRLVAITNSHDERIEYHYYGPTKAIMKAVQIGVGDPFWAFVYGGFNDYGVATTTVLDPLGSSSSYLFDMGLRLRRYTNADGELWKWAWRESTYNRILELTPAGVVRHFDVLSDDVATETQPSGNVITRTYAASPAENREDPRRRAILRIEDDLGLIESRTYSIEGVLESISTGTGDLTTFVFGASGELTVTDPTGVVTTYANRGNHGHYLSKTRGSRTVHYSYDLVGNLLTADGLIDEDETLGPLAIGQGGIIARSHDADRNISLVMLEDGGFGAQGLQSELRIEWRADHKRTRIDRPYGGDTEFEYDALGRMIEERTRVDGAWVSTFIEYDAKGRTSAVLKPNAMATRLTYRKAGEVASLLHQRDWRDASEVDEAAEFDYEDGRLIAIRDSAHAMVPQEYFYDAEGFIDEVRFPGGETLTFGRDLRGRVVTKQFWRPDASLLRSFEYDYDLANRQTAVREDGNAILDLFFAEGRVEKALFGNGIEVVNSYAAATGAFTGFTASDSAQQLVVSMTVATTTCEILLPAGRCLIEQTDTLVGVVATSYAEYQLEDQGSERLIADSHGSQLPIDGFHGYDELSNLGQSALGDFVYNPERNRLRSIENDGVSVVDYEYDQAGFVIERNGVPMTWNGMGRLASVGSGLVMQWDALGRKVSATVAGKETRWKYGGELTEDDLGANQKLDLGWVVCKLDDSTHEYRLFDFRGNSKLLINDLAEVTAHHHYSGYGQVAVDGSDESAMGFAGGTHVEELVLIGRRVYDPAARRFLSRDPIFQTINQYGYTLGNPVRFWDPGGDTSYILKEVGLTVGFVGPIPYIQIEITVAVSDGSGNTEGLAPSSPGSGGDGVGGSGSGTGACTPGCGNGGGPGTGSNGSPSGGGFSTGWSCGLGFEITPLLLTGFAIRKRSRGVGG